jgi:hypothetical protein
MRGDKMERKESESNEECLPGWHAVHAPEPGESLNIPVGHAVHGPPFTPIKPGLQAQSEEESLPAGEEEKPAMMP